MARTPAVAVAAAVAALSLAGCNAKPPATTHAGDAVSPEASYVVPPRVTGVSATAQGVSVSGQAAAGGQVRLASPAGQATLTTADLRGQWSVLLPPAKEPRVFGISASAQGRQTQAEGYLLVTPSGQAAVLRAGDSALRIDRPARPGLQAIDFDRGGGVEVSAAVSPGATVILRLDGRQVAEGRADAAGHYEASVASSTPIRSGTHQLQAFGDGFADQVVVTLSPAAPLAAGPLRSQFTPAGLRVDWMTPGGGVQSTLLVH